MSGHPKLAIALRRAADLGCIVEPVHRTGEIRVVCPCGAKHVKLNARKKDANITLMQLLAHVERGDS